MLGLEMVGENGCLGGFFGGNRLGWANDTDAIAV